MIGLKSTRFYQTVFTDFKVTSLTSFQYRNVADYLSYVKDGGNLIVLNTNGYGYFGNELFNLSNQTNDTGIIRKEIGGGNITYVNIYPILNDMENSNEKASYYQEIISFIKPLNSQLEHFEYSLGELLDFKKITMTENVTTSTSTLLFPLDVFYPNVSLTLLSGDVISYTNVTRISITENNRITINSSNMTLSNGEGFYSYLYFDRQVSLNSLNDSLSVSVIEDNGKENARINEVKTITINDEKSIKLLARQPTITIQGQIIFSELYSSGDLYQKTQTRGQDLTVTGLTKLEIYLSDTYSWANSINASGTFERSPL